MSNKTETPNPLWLIDDLIALLGLVLLLFSVYIFPHVFFNVNYPLPDFIFGLDQWMVDNYGFSDFKLKAAVFLPFFLASLLLFLISKLMTYYLEWHEQNRVTSAEGKPIEAELKPTAYLPSHQNKLMRPGEGLQQKTILLLIMFAIIIAVGALTFLYLFY